MIARGANNLHFGFALAAITLLLIVGPPKLLGQDTTPPDPKPWSFVFRVVDEDGKRIKDATVEALVGSELNSHQPLPNGDLRIERESKPQSLSLRCESEGKTPINAWWWSKNEIPGEAPEVFLVTLPTAKPIGGKIVDPEGNAVAGATVFIWTPSGWETLRPAIHDFTCQTDAQGKWSCPITPTSLKRVRLRLEHPEYLSQKDYGKAVSDAVIEELQTGAHVSVMRKGVTVRGKVVGPDGKPVTEANVFQDSDLRDKHSKTKTDQEGRFAFTNREDGSMFLTVVAQDFAPESLTIKVDEDLIDPVEFELSPSQPLTFKVIDAKGEPIPQAQVVIRGTSKHRFLYDSNLALTDENGVSVWKNASEAEAECDVFAAGFQNQGWTKVTAQDEPVLVKLYRPVRVKGLVVDAETGKPVERFRICPQSHPDFGNMPSHIQTSKGGKGGQYGVTFTKPHGAYSVLIKADGYVPQRSQVFKREDGDATFDFKLGQTFGLQGKVVSPQGVPVDGATVALTSKRFQTLKLKDGRIENLSSFVSASTENDGQFSLVSDKNAWQVYVCHELGFARIKGEFFEAGHEVKLSPWTIVNGKDLESDGDETQVQIRLLAIEKGDRRIKQEVATNLDGEFEFGKVVSGIQYAVERQVTSTASGGKGRRSSKVIAHLSAAAGTQVQLGQPGRKIVGKISPRDRVVGGVVKPKAQRPNYPDDFSEWAPARQQQWKSDWNKTDAGIRYHTNRSLEYPFSVTNDFFLLGPESEVEFEIEALPPGFYELSFEFRGGLGTDAIPRRLRVKKITAEEKDPQPQDLGVIEFKKSSDD